MASNQGTAQTGSKAFDSSVEAVSSSNKKTKRILRKIQKEPLPLKRYIWLGGHAFTLFFGGLFLIFYVLQFLRFFKNWYWIPEILYSLALIGVISSYTVTTLTTFGNVIPGYHTLLATLNFQNLILACVWLITRRSGFKLLPYYLVAVLQMADHFKVDAVMKFDETISEIIAFSETFIFVTLTFDTLLFRGTSGYALVIYCVFYWIRLNFSPYTQVYILRLTHLVDEKIMKNQKPEIQAKWNNVKSFLEYRRRVMTETLGKKLDHEVEIDAVDHSKTRGKPLGDKTKNYQLQGQKAISPSELTKGVIIPKDYEVEAKKLERQRAAVNGGKAPIAVA